LVRVEITPDPPIEQKQNQGEAGIELPLSTLHIPSAQEILADFDEDDIMKSPGEIIIQNISPINSFFSRDSFCIKWIQST